MRWSIVRLIAGREVKDLLRDRRTLFLVIGLPVLLYPVFGAVALLFARSLQAQATIVGVVGREHLPPAPPPTRYSLGAVAGSVALAADLLPKPPYPALIEQNRFVPPPDEGHRELGSAIVLIDLPADDDEQLRSRAIDAVLVIPPNVRETLDAGGQVELVVRGRDGDETSKLAVRRVVQSLKSWNRDVRWARLVGANLPANFGEPIKVTDPIESKGQIERSIDELRDSLVKIFPFLLIMWTMAGALHPAIDMTAGEKERGTMETLLISPAERVEIVAGKFLATTGFSYASAMWNVFWMGGGAVALNYVLGYPVISLAGLAWCVALALPLAMLFSAVCIALGVYARSTKEGQYYLMPLFLVTMPLTFWAMAPGMRLSWDVSLIPITGLALLLQQLMSPTEGSSALPYLVPVLGSLMLCVALSLAWAVRQFRREGVLFREATQPAAGASLFGRMFGRK